MTGCPLETIWEWFGGKHQLCSVTELRYCITEIINVCPFQLSIQNSELDPPGL